MKDWIIQYVKTKDIFTKQLKDYKVHSDRVEFDFGNKKHVYLFQPSLDDELVKKASVYETKSIVVEKTSENFRYLIENFDRLSEMKNLIMVFVSKDMNKKVLINPRMHSMVADPANLEIGLQTLWDSG